MGRHWGGGSHGRAIPEHIQRLLLRMPDIDGCWIAISPRKGFRRARLIAMDRLRSEVERLAIEKAFPPGKYSLFQVAHRSLSPAESPDRAVDNAIHTSWGSTTGDVQGKL